MDKVQCLTNKTFENRDDFRDLKRAVPVAIYVLYGHTKELHELTIFYKVEISHP